MNNPLLREIQNVSPAQSLGFIINDDVLDLRVGDIVLSSSDLLWKVQGFTYSNEVIVSPHGLGHDPLIQTVVFEAEGLRHLPVNEVWTHKDGLVSFSI